MRRAASPPPPLNIRRASARLTRPSKLRERRSAVPLRALPSMPLSSGFFRCALVVSCALLSSPVFAATAPESAPATATPSPQALVDAYQAIRHGGIAVAVINGDEIAFFNAGQFADDDARPITP